MKLKSIIDYLESFAPLGYQESYDNAGLIIGSLDDDVTGILITLDITEEVVEEAIQKKMGLIVSHHPILFGGIKKLNGKNYVERSVINAIKNNISIYASHTNIDSVIGGVNSKICDKLGLTNCQILAPLKNQLKKLVTFVPVAQAEKVRNAVFDAGAGHIGEYDSCSFNLEGTGTFKGNDSTNPFVGEKNQFHQESEIRIETVFPATIQSKVLSALLNAHPYEEPAYDIYPIENDFRQVGSGMIGELEEPQDEIDFLKRIKDVFNCGVVKHTDTLGRKIKRVAVCGGSGAFLLKDAIAQKADVFISSDFKYHQFFDAEKRLIIADIGHYESEQFTKDIFYELLTKKFPKFAVHLSEIKTNPVNYLI